MRARGHHVPARSLLLPLCTIDRDPDESIAGALDDVLQSARDVAARGVSLARFEAGEAVARGLQTGAVVLFAAILAGFVTAVLWWVAVEEVAWWLGLRFGAMAPAVRKLARTVTRTMSPRRVLRARLGWFLVGSLLIGFALGWRHEDDR